MSKIYYDPYTGEPIDNSEMKVRKPVIGEMIYMPTQLHVYNGRDDVLGGLAKIIKIEYSKTLLKDHYNYTMVMFEGFPHTKYNWISLLERQEELKEQFGDGMARPDPDDRPEFNDDNADWKYIK